MTTETASHTPGPWHHEGEFVYAKNPLVRIADTTVADGDEGRLPEAAADANARLIATAPELLKALEEILEHVEWRRRVEGQVTGANDCTHRARAAIAKATKQPATV